MKTLNITSAAITLIALFFVNIQIVLASIVAVNHNPNKLYNITSNRNVKRAYEFSICSFGYSRQITGSQHGVRNSVFVSAGNYSNQIEIGTLSTNKVLPTGGQLTYKHFAPSDNCGARLFFFGSLLYDNAAALDHETTSKIYMRSSELNSERTYSTAESYAGFGMRFNPLYRVALETSIGIGMYASNLHGVDDRPVTYRMTREDSGFALTFKLNISLEQ